MNLQHLYYFQKLSEVQHYAKASDALNVSQSNLSYAISSMEKELRVQFFEKKGRNIYLTSDGELFLEYVNRALNELEAGKDAVRHSFELNRDTVRIVAFCIEIAFELVDAFKSSGEYSEVNFALHHRKTHMLLRDLKNKRFDVGVTSYTKQDPALEFIPIKQQRLVALMHDKHPLANRETLDLQEIASLPVIIPNGSSDGMYRKIIGLFHAIGEQPIISCEADFASAAAYLASKDLGIALLVETPNIRNFNTKVIPIMHPGGGFFQYLVYAKDLWQIQAVHAFIKYVKASFSCDAKGS